MNHQHVKKGALLLSLVKVSEVEVITNQVVVGTHLQLQGRIHNTAKKMGGIFLVKRLGRAQVKVAALVKSKRRRTVDVLKTYHQAAQLRTQQPLKGNIGMVITCIEPAPPQATERLYIPFLVACRVPV